MTERKQVHVFVVGLFSPQGPATEIVLCNFCKAVRYTSRDNMEAALAKGMTVACMECAAKMIPEDESAVVGMLHKGRLFVNDKNRRN